MRLIDGSALQLPVSSSAPLFVVGPNGAGKSGLISTLFRLNHADAVRISAHRQTWMESNAVPFSPQDKIRNEQHTRGQDSQPDARWKEWNSGVRSGLVIADLIESDNKLSRQLADAYRSGNEVEAVKLAAEPQPLAEITELFAGSGISIKLEIGENSTIIASKNGGTPYSIALLSDGERAALLIAGTILTAKKGALILVDEPERHLHASIVTPLLLQLFGKRPDCTFVVSTHELSLPVGMPTAKTVLVRDSKAEGNDVTAWDLDVLEPGIEVDDATKEAIIGSRRKMLFIEGTSTSLDKPLYELLFPGVSIFPRQSCRDVEHAVVSVRDAEAVTWVQAFGIVDQDQISPAQRSSLIAKGIYPLSVYSVESLYYSPTIIAAVAQRQCDVVGEDPAHVMQTASANLVAAIASEVDRLAARMTEQAVKDKISMQMPDWKTIQRGQNVNITVDAQAMYQAEKAQLQSWIAAKDVEKIVGRYPIRETMALAAVVNALQFKSRGQYEAAVRKLASDNESIRATLIGHFGGLVAALA
ncbi:AAA domain-containing protein, putative AbiEii toxin, Type IV TA system [Mesorhizobium australicum]|uniref:AAA domain-containing protein, putative AbiEii toxin, Type IV TA system n=1 Tax=Mesorhizobium australicum TaxID=536018 RepID=A0A1X7PUX5_9HYPH|nr:AAA domain-containing protein, putative AbiEii toxin, Type IV TA system [Mesorhizobium australicum]